MSKNTPKHYMDIRITFTKKTDEYDPTYTYFEPKKAYQVESTLPQGEGESIAETWAQSDHYQLLSTELIIDALCDNETDLRR